VSAPSPRIVIGVPLYNHSHQLAESLESLLAQSRRDVAFVLVDDSPSDESTGIVKEYQAVDSRIVYHKNERRLGMVGNWRRAFELAEERFPAMEYFAWGSDHDVWHPRWLEEMAAALDGCPDAVLAYPMNIRIDEAGEVFRTAPWRFDTRGIAGPLRRFSKTTRGMSAGNMVYGLYRAWALKKAGVYRFLLLPDRLMLAELSLYGSFVQVRQLLWYRRYVGLVTMSRQRASFFPEGAPAYSYLPWWINHAAALAWHLSVKKGGSPSISPAAAWIAAIFYGAHGAMVEVVRPFRWVWKKTRIFLLRPVRRFYLTAAKPALRRFKTSVLQPGGSAA
jgi:glycosyltransferase involved in cell wall biosynthesis